MKSAEMPLQGRIWWRREELIKLLHKLLVAEEEERTEADQQDLEEKEEDEKEEEAATTSSTNVYLVSPKDKNMRALKEEKEEKEDEKEEEDEKEDEDENMKVLKDNILKQIMATVDQDGKTDQQDQSCSSRRQTLGERKKAEIALGVSRRPRHSLATPTEVMVLINSFVSCTCSLCSWANTHPDK